MHPLESPPCTCISEKQRKSRESEPKMQQLSKSTSAIANKLRKHCEPPKNLHP